ncbi:MAG: sigma-70 family RNA polymerase sigma factor [Fimbriimonadaceae bacterium]|nr:sigma-70 family RNA polymerase sigma factor [Fimbriimonadaceae bacterium]
MATTTSALYILHEARMNAPEELPEAFWSLVERYRAELFNQALAMLGEAADAEDVVQETFCEAYRQGARLAQVRSLGAWLRTINRGNARNRLRDRRADVALLARRRREAPPRAVTTGGFSRIELREAVAKAIESLPAKYRGVVTARYVEQLSYDEIAQRLGLSSGTVGWLLCEAGLLLHARLKTFLAAAEATDTAIPDPDAAGEPQQGEC